MKYYLVSPGADDPARGRKYYWSLDNGDVWIGVARGIWRNKHGSDVVTEVVEADHITQLDWTKTPFHSEQSTSGWLSRDGRFYGCPSIHHDVIAHCVLGMKVGDMEDGGWARVFDSSRFTCERRLSTEQRNWLLQNGYEVFDSH